MIVIDYLNQIHSSVSSYRSPSEDIDFRLTEVIQPSDLRGMDPRKAKAIQEEVRDLLSRSQFKVILKEELQDARTNLLFDMCKR